MQISAVGVTYCSTARFKVRSSTEIFAMDCRQSTVFHFRCPSSIRVALKDESNRQLISPSAYARRAIIRSLQVDGAIRLNLGEAVADKAAERSSVVETT